MPPLKHEDIAVTAYLLWEANPDSDAEANWLEAQGRLMAALPDSELLQSPDVVNLAAHAPKAKK